jgi:hypothetical protein
MIEVRGNLWSYEADVRVITTNGFVRKDGRCVMGRGCAFEATQRQPGIDKALGDLIKKHGNHVFRLTTTRPSIWSMPVKHHWRQKADIELIRRSAHELVEALRYDDVWPFDGVCVLPRPGCGNGQLNWADVRPVLEQILDDKFHVITW